jgi:alkanesulfonate monooxygenase SsuD/methylene tetrahydromethanopterin reductase-like flavin-dependent oxidoreductase (luciferase family)
MFHVGYKLSSEEFGPTELIRQAVRAETAGFDFALISDHFHPWCVHQIGPDQEGFTRFYEAEILPRVRHVLAPRRSSLSRTRAA